MSVAGMDELIETMTNAESILIFTGAGISTGSGIPDYRGPQGLWKTRTPIYFQDFMAEKSARQAYWLQKSEDWQTFCEAKPTAAHQAITALEEAGKLRTCITQNIDGLHAAAGTKALIELHGSNAVAECMGCGAFQPASPLYDSYKEGAACPTCESCGAWLKPGVISFGQSLREADLMAAQQAVPTADFVLALGSTLSVQPAANFPLIAARMGAPYMIINQGPTEHDGHPLVTTRIEGDLQQLFSEAVDAALAMQG